MIAAPPPPPAPDPPADELAFLPEDAFEVGPDDIVRPLDREIPDERGEGELGASLLAKGQLEDGLVSCRRVNGKWVLLEGHTRAKLLFARGLRLRVRVAGGVATEEQEEEFILASAVRSNRHELETAMRIDAWMRRTGCTQAEAGKKAGLDAVRACRVMAPLKANPAILEAYRRNPRLVTLSHVAELRRLKGDPDRQLELLAEVESKALSVADLKARAKPRKSGRPHKMDQIRVDGAVLSYPARLTLAELESLIENFAREIRSRRKSFDAKGAPASLVFAGN